MLTSSVLTTVVNYFETSKIFSHDPKNSYELQITPEERPFPASGNDTITFYATSLRRVSEKQQIAFKLGWEMCVTRKILDQPRDKQFRKIYLDTMTSLCDTAELLGYNIDSNTILLSNILASIANKVTTISSILSNIDTTNTDSISDTTSRIGSLQVLQPMQVAEIINRPIPRYDDFFTSISLNNPPDVTAIQQPSGYSMKVLVSGPVIVVDLPC